MVHVDCQVEVEIEVEVEVVKAAPPGTQPIMLCATRCV